VRVLINEKVEVNGLQIVAVLYRDAALDGHFRSVLQGIRLDRDRASILLTHAPDHPKLRRLRAFLCSYPGKRTLGSSYLGVGWRGGFTASLSTA
jgi:hypothetical protein